MSSFWGVEVKSGRPYTHHPKNGVGKLHITQATLGSGSATKKSTVQCNVGDKSPIFLCTLFPDRAESCPLHLEFEGDDEVTFSVIGPRSVHLSGFFSRNNWNYDEDDDSHGEDIAETETDESTDFDSEDEFDDNFIDDDDDDLVMFPSSPVRNSGVVIEEILDDEKATNEKSKLKKLDKKNKLQKSDDDNISPTQQQIVIKNNSGVEVMESEDEDGFPIQMAETETEKLNDNRTTMESKKRKKKKSKVQTKNDDGSFRISKRKIDTFSDGGESERKMTKKTTKENDIPANGNEDCDTCKEDGIRSDDGNTSNIDHTKPLENKPDKMDINNDADLDADEKHSEKKKKKKKKKKKAKTEVVVGDAGNEQTVSATASMESEEKAKVQLPRMKTFGNGLVVEDITMGKPDGKRASLGKKVSVFYIGKLKSNGKIFDSNIGKAPFKFRLGVNQVIKGWDIGVQGMRVGDKRRLTIPPAMAYGDKRVGPIPQNSWLTFDVELVDVQ